MLDIDNGLSEAKAMRRAILRVCERARPVGAGEWLICQALNDSGFAATRHDVREQLDYLEGKGLLTVTLDGVQDRERGTWVAKITPAGVDVAEGAVPLPTGIGKG